MTLKKEEWFKTWFDTSYYHILYQNRDFEEAERFITNLLDYLKLPGSANCLDLACGKGRHAVYLNKKGLKVTGLDLSENSISEADRKSTRLNSSHVRISYAVFCLKKKKVYSSASA